MRNLITFVLILFINSSVSLGQLLNKSHGWIRLNQQVIQSDSYFNAAPSSMVETIRTTSYYFTSITGEYGISKRISIMVYVPFVRVTINELKFNQSGYTEMGGSLNTIGDADVGLQFAFRKKLPVQVLGFAVAGLPFGKRGTVGTETNLQTGDGEFNVLTGVKLLQTFSKISLSGLFAFNKRTDNYSNEIRYGLEIVYSSRPVRAKLRYQGIESLFNKTAPVSVNGIFSNHRELYMPGAEILCNISKNLGVYISTDVTVAGRNTLKGTLWGLGIQINTSSQ